jgi:acyl-CoA synthetase (AMP-forming)/AMP-acid ligase II
MHGHPAPLHGLRVKIVGKKVKERLGGRVRFLVSGGAAMPKAVAEFYLPLGITVLQGYGLTETTAVTSVNHPDNNRYETIGQLIPGIEAKIADDGELLLRGISRMIGYYNMPKETAEAIDGEGWFHTGDIAQKEGDYYKIIDRKKEIIVLGNGKNVAPQMIENRLRESEFIADAVVVGDAGTRLRKAATRGSASESTTRSAPRKSPAGRVVVTAIERIPARSAASTPAGASSITTHVSRATPSRRAAMSSTSGSGLPCGTSSSPTTVSK